MGASGAATAGGYVDRRAGARWWSIDLHAHSPASFDFGGSEGEASSDPKPTYKEWVQSYIDAGLDAVVVTDHNTHVGIDEARRALEELKVEDPGIELAIFAGVELTAHGGTHVLAIMDAATDAEAINRLITLAGFEGERGRSDETAAKTVKDIAAAIVAQGGICVPAHADQNRGVFGLDSRDVKALAAAGHIKAVEVIDEDALKTASKLGWVPVLGSDTHHLTIDGCPEGQDPKAPGTHFTRFKAGELNLEGIRLALTDPSGSVQRCKGGDPNPNEIEHEHIKTLQVRHGDAEETYVLNPWMTCLIGGRGVGKSMILELLRLALGRSDELSGAVATELARYAPDLGDTPNWWNEDTELTVEYVKDGRPLRIVWSGASSRTPLIESWDGETWSRQSGAAADRAPIRIFSQKQIFELANSPQSLLAIVDDMPEIEKDSWNAEYDALRLKFKAERSRLRQLRAEAEEADRIKGRLEEVQARLAKLAELQEAEQYRDLEAAEARLAAVDNAETDSAEIEKEVARLAERLRQLAPSDFELPEYQDRMASFRAAVDGLDAAQAALAVGRTSWEATGHVAEWEARVAALSAWVAEQVGGASDASQQILQDRQREAALLAELSGADDAVTSAEELEQQLEQILHEIRAKRDELYERRKAYVDALSSADTAIQVRVFRQGQVGGLEAELRTLLKRPDAFDSAFAADGIAKDLLDANERDPRYPKKVESFKEELVAFVEGGRDSTIGERLRVDNRFYTQHLAGLDVHEAATEILLWYPEDLLEVRYRPREGGNFEPVDRGSPGQRTAALLAVILQMGSEPLLLDQPEDDLENKLIKSLIVESLKRIKTNRQVVVATHNANIVVTSSAEEIIVLEHGDLPLVEAAGTLQVNDVRAAVCLILEGGEDAIRARYQRLVESVVD